MTTRSKSVHRTSASSQRTATASASRRENSSTSRRSSSVSAGISREVARAIFTSRTSTTGCGKAGSCGGREERKQGRKKRGHERVPSKGTLHLVRSVSGLDPGGPHLPVFGRRLVPNHRAFLGGRALDLRVGVPVNRRLFAGAVLDDHHFLVVVDLGDCPAHRLSAHVVVLREGDRRKSQSENNGNREKPLHR